MTYSQDTPPASPPYKGLAIAFGLACAAMVAYWLWQSLTAPQRLAAESQTVVDVIKLQEAAWNAGDLDGFMAAYRMTEDITFYSRGEIQTGWVALRERYDQRYRTDGQPMGRLTFSDLQVQVVSRQFAVARGRWKVERAGRTAEGLFTLFLNRESEGWRIVHDHTSAALE